MIHIYTTTQQPLCNMVISIYCEKVVGVGSGVPLPKKNPIVSTARGGDWDEVKRLLNEQTAEQKMRVADEKRQHVRTMGNLRSLIKPNTKPKKKKINYAALRPDFEESDDQFFASHGLNKDQVLNSCLGYGKRLPELERKTSLSKSTSNLFLAPAPFFSRPCDAPKSNTTVTIPPGTVELVSHNEYRISVVSPTANIAVADTRMPKTYLKSKGRTKMLGRVKKNCTPFENLSLPFSHSEYTAILNAFEDLDKDNNGTLDWSELCGVGTRIGGKLIDYRDFKKMDKDRSGTVDFLELLRVFFPTTQVPTLRSTIKRWGAPHSDRRGYGGKWQEVLPADSCRELLDIYNFFTGNGENLLSFEVLRSFISQSSIPDNELLHIFEDHDNDLDGILSLDEFVQLMDAVYGRRSEPQSLKLFYQPEYLMREL